MRIVDAVHRKSSPTGPPVRGREGALALLYVACWVGAWHLAGLLTVAPGSSTWYPPAALTFALLAYAGPRLLPLPLLASLIAGHGLWADSWWVNEALGSLSHVASYAFAALLYRRLVGGYVTSPRARSLIALMATGALGAVASALLGSLNHAAAADGPMQISGAAVVAWAAGDLLAVVTLAPTLLFLGPAVARRRGALSGVRPLHLLGGLAVPLAVVLALTSAGWTIGALAGVEGLTVALVVAGPGLVFLCADLAPARALAVIAPAGAAAAVWIGTDPSAVARIEHALLLTSLTVCCLGALARAQNARRQRATGLHLRTRLKQLGAATARAQRNLGRVEQRIAEAGHELRTPLNAIIGFSELTERRARDVLKDPKTVDHAGTVADSGRYLLVLINDILDAASLYQGTFRPRTRAVDPAEVLAGVMRMCRYRADAKGQTLRLQPPDTPLACSADPTRLRQVLTNLTINAIKYAPEASPIDLSVRGDAGGVEVLIRDRGPGMSDSDLEVALSRYGRLSGGASEEGTGLGLPLALRLVREMGGRHEIETHPGGGTRFRLIFPTADAGGLGGQAAATDSGAGV